jgi:hypothetical protein
VIVVVGVGLAWRATVGFVRVGWWLMSCLAAAVAVWARLLAGRPGEPELVVVRRRKWLLLALVSGVVVAASMVAPMSVLQVVGVYPALVALILLAVSVVMIRRSGSISGPVPAAPAPVVVGDYQPTARSVEVERALGHMLWHFAAHGLPVATAVDAARAMPPRSRLWLLTVAETQLAALGRLEDQGHFGSAEAAVWLFPFCQSLRAELALPANVPVER